MKALALWLILAYQSYWSPYKGFCCAYRFYTGNRSCSALGLRAIRRFGVITGARLIMQRFRRCALAFQRYGARLSKGGSRHHQAGYCDLGFVPVDAACGPPVDASCCMPDFSSTVDFPHGVLSGLDVCDCLPSPCDCVDWNLERERHSQAGNVHIPPVRRPFAGAIADERGQPANRGRSPVLPR